MQTPSPSTMADAITVSHGQIRRPAGFRFRVRAPLRGYFETIGTPILRGRGFEAGDVVGAQEVAVITESLAERLWPGQDSLGKRVSFGFDRRSSRDLLVVGIVGDVVENTTKAELRPSTPDSGRSKTMSISTMSISWVNRGSP